MLFRSLLADVPNFAAQIDAQLAKAMAVKLDLAGLYGAGIGSEPQGLRNNSDVNEISMGTNGAAQASYDDLLTLLQKIWEHNVTPTAMVQSPRSAIKLQKLVTGLVGDLTKLEQPDDLDTLTQMVSNQISITETQGSSSAASTTFMGDFTQIAFAIRQAIQIEASRVSDTAFSKNQTLIRAILRADIAIYRPTAFGRLVGIL